MAFWKRRWIPKREVKGLARPGWGSDGVDHSEGEGDGMAHGTKVRNSTGGGGWYLGTHRFVTEAPDDAGIRLELMLKRSAGIRLRGGWPGKSCEGGWPVSLKC